MNFLDEHQLYNGEFKSYVANDESMEGTSVVDSCTFVTSCILYSLSFLHGEELATMKRTAHKFLIQQMKPPGVWAYYSSRNPTRITPDLDDTALASFVVREVHPEVLGGRNIDIILGNRNQEGLFFTWLGKNRYADDVDSVVNANVLLYLGDRDETKCASDYLNTIIVQQRESQSYYYYLNDLALYYAISRAYFHGVASLKPCREAIISRIVDSQQENGSWRNELWTALAVSTLLNYSFDDSGVLDRAFANLLNTQRKDGSWSRRSFFCGILPTESPTRWYGSEELTTGFCLEALTRFCTAVT